MNFYLNAETLEQLGDPIAGKLEIKWLRPRIPQEPGFTIQDIKPLGSHQGLKGFLKKLGLDESSRDQLVELYYSTKPGRRYYGLAWQNEAGGWEVMNGQWRGCLGLKGITLVPGQTEQLAVFADFMDYLRWRKFSGQDNPTVLVLNRPGFLQAAIYMAKFFPTVSACFGEHLGSRKLSFLFRAAVPHAQDLGIPDK